MRMRFINFSNLLCSCSPCNLVITLPSTRSLIQLLSKRLKSFWRRVCCTSTSMLHHLYLFQCFQYLFLYYNPSEVELFTTGLCWLKVPLFILAERDSSVFDFLGVTRGITCPPSVFLFNIKNCFSPDSAEALEESIAAYLRVRLMLEGKTWMRFAMDIFFTSLRNSLLSGTSIIVFSIPTPLPMSYRINFQEPSNCLSSTVCPCIILCITSNFRLGVFRSSFRTSLSTSYIQ